MLCAPFPLSPSVQLLLSNTQIFCFFCFRRRRDELEAGQKEPKATAGQWIEYFCKFLFCRINQIFSQEHGGIQLLQKAYQFSWPCSEWYIYTSHHRKVDYRWELYSMLATFSTNTDCTLLFNWVCTFSLLPTFLHSQMHRIGIFLLQERENYVFYNGCGKICYLSAAAAGSVPVRMNLIFMCC